MNKLKKLAVCGLIGVNLALGTVNIASADDGLMVRLENAVNRIEKALNTAPAKFTKSTLVDVKNVKIVSQQYGGKQVTGELINNTGCDIDTIFLTFKGYDVKGNVVDENISTVIESVKNGENHKFNISLYKEGCSSVKISEVKVDVTGIN